MNETLIYSGLTLLALSIVLVTIFRRINLPPILAYLLIGIVVGPNAVALIENQESIRLLAEIGVIFLLFSIGLHFSFTQLMTMKKAVLGLGGVQVILTTLLGMGLTLLILDISWQGAIVVGGTIALSSTAIVAKQLTEQLEIQSDHGRLAVGALLFQDIAVVPFLVMIPILSRGDGLGTEVILSLVKGLGIFIILVSLSHQILRPIFHIIASARSAELFTLAVLFIALTAGALTHSLGLSAALGAFLAGIMLSESEYRHQIDTDIRPFRDILMGLFFITIGIQLDFSYFADIWTQALILLVFLILGKGLIVIVISRLMGYERTVALRCALILAQGGEFGFALLALALNSSLISTQQSQAILLAIIISMIVAPILIRENGNLAKRLYGQAYIKTYHSRTKIILNASRELKNYVIIIGYGRIGQNLASFLRQEHIEYVALDVDPIIVKEAYEAGEPVYFGDATQVAMLRATGIQRASAMVITPDDIHTANKVLQITKERNPDLPIITRTQDDTHLETLENAGAHRVVPEKLESSMMLATYLLEVMKVPTEKIFYLVEKTRADHYYSLRGYFHGTQAESVEDIPDDHYRLHTVVLAPGSHAIGKTIQDLHLGEKGVSVISIRRGQIRGEAPDPSMVLRQGDALLLESGTEALADAEITILSGYSKII